MSANAISWIVSIIVIGLGAYFIYQQKK